MRVESKREQGAALLVSVLVLALMGIIGLSAMETVTRDRQIAGFQSRAQTSLYAAEAGIAYGMGLLRRDAQGLAQLGEGALIDYNPSSGSPPDFPDQSTAIALGSDFPAPGPPEFYLDLDASNPRDLTDPPQAVRYIGRGNPCTGWIMSSSLPAVQWAEALWDIRVRGENPDGTQVNIQSTGSNCHPYN